MRRPNLFTSFVQAIDANVGGTIQDRAPVGTLIAGYMIILRGANVGGAAVALETDVGQIILRSALFGDLLTEPHAGFLMERTIQKKGNTRFINTGVALSDIDISLFHDFDLSGDYSHGTVYGMLPGDSLEWIFPAIAAGVMTGTWEVHRIEADAGNCSYFSRWRTRGLPVAEIGFTFDGRSASLMFMPAAGVGAANPDRVSIFDPSNKREMFLSFDSFLAWTNAQFRYDADQANYACYERFSDVLESIKRVFMSTQLRVEFTGGAGLVVASYSIIEEAPEPMRRLVQSLSADSVAISEQKALETGVSSEALVETGSQYIPTGLVRPKTALTVEPVTSAMVKPRHKSVLIF